VGYSWSIFIGRVSRNYIEMGAVPIGVFGILLTLISIPFSDSLAIIGGLFFLYGFFSGLLIVPLNSLIQFATPKGVWEKY